MFLFSKAKLYKSHLSIEQINEKIQLEFWSAGFFYEPKERQNSKVTFLPKSRGDFAYNSFVPEINITIPPSEKGTYLLLSFCPLRSVRVVLWILFSFITLLSFGTIIFNFSSGVFGLHLVFIIFLMYFVFFVFAGVGFAICYRVVEKKLICIFDLY